MTVVFIGGAPGIGKSTLAIEVARRIPSFQAVSFSDLMVKGLPKGVNPKRILSVTSPAVRKRARIGVVRSLRRIRSNVIVAGHYAVVAFDHHDWIGNLEVSFPREMADYIDAAVLAYRSRPFRSNSGRLQEYLVWCALEEMVFKHVCQLRDMPSIRLSLENPAVATRRLSGFVRQVAE